MSRRRPQPPPQPSHQPPTPPGDSAARSDAGSDGPRPAADAASPKNPPAKPGAESHSDSSPLSLSRLRAAFAEMLNADTSDGSCAPAEATSPQSDTQCEETPAPDPCEVSPRTVVEAMLFVGRPDDRPLTAREMAAAMRGVSPAEIDDAVCELNGAYERDAAPYQIVGSAKGYRFSLRDEFGRMRDKLIGHLKETKLSTAAVEVLSIVAYNQPTTAEAVGELRGLPSGPALASLVRRRLVRIDQPANRSEPPHYSTTDRFLHLFGLESAAALPQSEELENG